MARLLLKCTGSSGQVLHLRAGQNRLGRNPANELRLFDPSVSSFHCEIIVSEDSVTVKDLGSTNGTFVNNDLIEEALLRPGQTLQLGVVRLLLESESESPAPAVSIPELSLPAPPLRPFLADGSPACLHHNSLPATFECTVCHYTFCEECIRTVGVHGGKSMHFCLNCDGQCRPIHADVAPPFAAPAESGSTPSLLSRLTDTLRLPFRR